MMMYVNYFIHLRHKVKNENLVEQKKFFYRLKLLKKEIGFLKWLNIHPNTIQFIIINNPATFKFYSITDIFR